MKRVLFFTTVCCLLLPAQEFRHTTGYIGGGFTTPLDTFADRHDTGWNILAGVGYRFNPIFGLNFEYTFNDNNYSFASPLVSASSLSGTTQLHGFTLSPRVNTPRFWGMDAYFTGGYGIYDRRFELTRPGVGTTVVCDPYWYYCGTVVVPVDVALGTFSTWKQGWNVGGGFEFGGSVKFFTDIRYLWVANPNVRIQSLPVSFGVRF